MKEYTFQDPDNDEYVIVVPRDTVNQIIREHAEKMFYLTVGLLSITIGFLVGVIVK